MLGIAVVIVGESHNPSVLTGDFLRHNKIVPEGAAPNLELPPLCTPNISQISYEGGLQIVSNPQRISFSERYPANHPVCPDTAIRYIRTERSVKYTAVGVNPFGFFPGNGQTGNLLKGGEWQRFQDSSPVAEIALTYRLGGHDVNLTVSQGNANLPDGTAKDGVVFQSNFHKPIETGQNESHMVAASMVGEWETDLERFRRLAENVYNEMKG